MRLSERILIIVPASLVKQWQFEVQNKFNINFTVYDGKKIKELKRKGNYKHPEILQKLQQFQSQTGDERYAGRRKVGFPNR